MRRCLYHDEGLDSDCTCDEETIRQRQYDEWVDYLIDKQREEQE
jgi:hypothetical protein